MKLRYVFGIGVLVGAMASVAYFAHEHRKTALQTHALTNDVSVTDQLSVGRVQTAKQSGFKTIVDLRPDGEVPDQPSSMSIGKASSEAGLRFAYIPVPHGDIPMSAVDELSRTLSSAPKPVLLYCRTGRRAARTWAIVEANRPGGLDAASIERVVQNAGQSADDLDSIIANDVADRDKPRQ